MLKNYCPPKKSRAQSKGEEKISCLRKLPNPSPVPVLGKTKLARPFVWSFTTVDRKPLLHERKYLVLESHGSACKLWFCITLYSFEWWFPMLLFDAMSDVTNYTKTRRVLLDWLCKYSMYPGEAISFSRNNTPEYQSISCIVDCRTSIF